MCVGYMIVDEFLVDIVVGFVYVVGYDEDGWLVLVIFFNCWMFCCFDFNKDGWVIFI